MDTAQNQSSPVQENLPEPPPTASLPTAPLAPKKIGKFKASRMIVHESWQVLKQDKELAWFPILSVVVSLGALLLLAVIMFFVMQIGGDTVNTAPTDTSEDNRLGALGYMILFIYYLVMFFIANYFTAGLYTIVHARFSGQDMTFSQGLANANKNLKKIFLWSLISATVGVVLQIIADRLKIAGKIVVWLVGAAWNILTYFSLPSLIIGQKNVNESFKESATVIRKTWGETIIVNFGVGLFFMFIFFLALALAIGIVILASSWTVATLVAILLVIFVIAMTIISSTLGAIFKLAIYEYAVTGNVPQGFTPDLVRGAIKPK